MGFGGVGWTTPSNRAKYGTIYSYDYNQGVVFPGALTTNGTVNVSSGDLKLSSSGTIWCSQFNDASGISLRNSWGGATQIGTSQRGMHLCSGSQPEWWMNGAKKDTIAMKSDIGNGKITIQKNGMEVGSFTTNQSSGKTINLTLGIDDIPDLRSQLNGKQPSGAYAERQSAETITGDWTFRGTTNFNGTTKVNGNEIASKGYVDGIFDSKLNASEATNFAKFTKFDSDTLKMTGARLYRTSAGDAVDRSSMYGYSSQNTHGTTYTRFAGMATIGSSQAFIGYYQYTKADGSGGDYIGNVTLSNGRLARINGSLSSVNELTDAYAVLSDLNNKANKTHTHAISDVTNLQTSLDEKASKSDVDSMNSQIDLLKLHNKVYYIYTWRTDSDFYGQGSAINEQFETNNAVFSVEMQVHIDTTPAKNACLNAQYVGVLTAKDLKEGDIIVVAGYPPRYISDVIVHSRNGITRYITYQFSILNKQFLDRINGKANVGHTHAISEITNLQSTLNGKQATLVSGTNIKTINGNSILGRGNISIASLLTEKQFSDIINATSSKSSYIIMDKLLIQWGVFIGAHGDTTNWTVTYPKTFYWYPSVILQTKDTNTNNQGLPYSNGAVITNYNNGTSFTFQLRRSESCPVYWIAIGGLS